MAEDDPVNRLVMTRLLEQLGFCVDVAATGREAVEMHDSGDYQAIFMDCQMPELDGYQAAAVIRRHEMPRQHVPIVALTANTVAGTRERCLAAGMDDYVGKPVLASELENTLMRTLGRTSVRATDYAARTESRASVSVAPVDRSRPLVDQSRLADLFGTERHALDDLVRMFLTRSQAAIEELAAAVEADDRDAAAHLAHGLKGSAGVVGADRLADVASRFCEALTSGADRETAAIQTELAATFEMTHAALTAPPAA